MAKLITISCPNPQCGWYTRVEADFDSGPSFLTAREQAARVLAGHECTATPEGGGDRRITDASEVIRTVELGRATPAEIRAAKREQERLRREAANAGRARA
jgi:hypothetical protein